MSKIYITLAELFITVATALVVNALLNVLIVLAAKVGGHQ